MTLSKRTPSRAPAAARIGIRARRYLNRGLIYTVMTLGSVVMLFPFVWMILSSFKLPGQIIRYPPVWIPNPWTLANYQRAWAIIDVGVLFANSIIQAVAATALSLVTSCLAGYVLAKFEFPGRDLIFISILSTMMIPWPVFLLPQYVVIARLKLLDTRTALILPAIYSSFGIFLLRQYMHTVPGELLDAARIDGAGEQRIFWRIVFPLCQPALAALGIFTFLWNWDNLLWPLIVLSKENLYTLPLGMALAVNRFWTEYGVVMAGATISVVPVLIVYLTFQRSFVEGIALTGMKA